MAFREVAVAVLAGGLLLAGCDTGSSQGKGDGTPTEGGAGVTSSQAGKSTVPGTGESPPFDPSQFSTPFSPGAPGGMGPGMQGTPDMGESVGKIPNPYSEEPIEYREASEEEIRSLVTKLGEPIDPVTKSPGGMGAARDLMGIGPKAAPILMEALEDENPILRQGAMFVLANMFHKEAVPLIAKILDSDEDHDARITAAKALGIIRSEQAVEALLRHVHTKDSHARFFVLNSLGQQEDPKAIPALAEVAIEDKDAVMRRSAIYALGLIKDTVALEHLRKVLDDPDDDIRMQATRAMGEIGGQETLPHLKAALEDTSANVRREAIYAMNSVGGQEVLDALAQLLEKERKDFVIHMALWSIGQLGDESHMALAKRYVDEPDVKIKERALRTMHMLEGQPSFGEVRNRLESEDPHIRLYTLWLLGIEGTSDNENIPDLVKMIDDEDLSVRRAVVGVMGQFRSRELVPVFQKIIEEEEDVEIVRGAVHLANVYTTRVVFYDGGALGNRAPEEMQMLYVRAEDDLVPAYIDKLMHEDLLARKSAQTAIWEASGLDFGYAFDDSEENRAAARDKIAAWWKEKSETGARAWTRNAVEEAIGKLEAADPVQREILSDALRSVTGQPYRLSVESTPEQVAQVLGNWQKWWEANKDRSRLEWLVDGLADEARPLEERMAIFTEIYWFYTGEHFGTGPSSPTEKKREAIGQFFEWWKENSEQVLAEQAGK